jgi:hypothetical protein
VYTTDRTAELIARNRTLLAKTADERARTSEIVIMADHLHKIVKVNAAERRRCNRATPLNPGPIKACRIYDQLCTPDAGSPETSAALTVC